MNGEWSKAESAARLSFGDFAEEPVDPPAMSGPQRPLLAVLALAALAAMAVALLF